MFCNNYKNKTRIEAFRELKRVFKKANIKDNETKAKLLLSNAVGLSAGDMFLNGDTLLSRAQSSFIKISFKKILKGMPFQYAIKSADFYGFKFYVDKRVLIPRFETEFLVKEAILSLKQNKKDVLDICTGSGCIAISVKESLPYVKVTASDISKRALKVAKKNAKDILGKDSISFIKSDMFNNIKGKFDVITANPPYVCESEYLGLDPYVTDYEPKGALLGGEDGLFYYKIIARDARKHLKENGVLIIEVGYGQKDSINEIFSSYFKNVKWIKDFSDIDRVAVFKGKD